MRWLLTAFASASCGMALVANVHAAPVDEFYKGKQISLVVNYTAGGPTDTEARLLARHLSSHIPGAPQILVRNMAGAGGMIAVNWLGQVALHDGLTLGYMTGIAAAAATNTPSLKIDPTKLPFISGVESVSVYYGRTDTGGGLHEPADLMKKSRFWVGGLTPDSAKDISLRAELDLLGLDYKYISGYPGAAEVRMALEHNEVQVTSESLPTFRASIEPALVDTGQVTVLWYDTSAKYSETGDPDAKGIKASPFPVFYRQVKGNPPDSDLWKLNALVGELSTSLLRTIHLPPDSPPESVEIMRNAMAALAEDPEYRADALQVLKYVPRFAIGSQAEKTYLNAVAADPALKSFAEAYVAKGYASVGK